MPKTSFAFCTILLALALGSSRASAQLCFRGQMRPGCEWFFVTESGYGFGLTGGGRHYLSGDVGLMRNLSGRDAIGGTLFGGFIADNGFDGRWGVKVRYRRWMSDVTSLEISPGIAMFQIPGTGESRLGFTSHLAVNLADKLVLFAQVEANDRTWFEVSEFGMPIEHTASGSAAWYLGTRLGSKPAVWTTLAVSALAGIGALLRPTW